jgi:serine/threonine-protein kinase
MSRPSNAPPANSVFASKYTVVRTIGQGGMGVVLEAVHTKLGQPVAIKLLKSELASDHESVMRFEREARAAATLMSRHAARIYDVDATAEGVPFMVMEYLEGRDLGSILHDQGILPQEDAVDWVIQACAAMAEAHALGIVHRDLKPSNLFLSENATGGAMVKVLDFGISKVASESELQLTNTETVLGTPHYMSPEQLTQARVVDGRADIWALAVILYRSLTKAFPFNAPHPTALAVSIATDAPASVNGHGCELPPALAAAIMKGLEKDPDTRHANVHAFAEAIAPFGSGRWNVPAPSEIRLRGATRSIPPTPGSLSRQRGSASKRAGIHPTGGTWRSTARRYLYSKRVQQGVVVLSTLISLAAIGYAVGSARMPPQPANLVRVTAEREIESVSVPRMNLGGPAGAADGHTAAVMGTGSLPTATATAKASAAPTTPVVAVEPQRPRVPVTQAAPVAPRAPQRAAPAASPSAPPKDNPLYIDLYASSPAKH